MRPRLFISRAAVGFVLALAALPLAACGGSEPSQGDGAQLRITRDFGQMLVASAREPSIPDGQTALDFLRSSAKVLVDDTGSVRSVAGVQGNWSYWVNGVAPADAPGDYELAAGDRVQWDRNDAAKPSPAIVGAYPQPLSGGWEGKRRPVRLECEEGQSQACKDVEDQLAAVGVPASKSSIGAPYTETVTRFLVGRWPVLRQSVSALERGPEASGVYARFAHDGSSMDLLDAAGEPAREVLPGDGIGIVAALFPREDQLAWVVTGLDDRGVAAAARALDPRTLHNAFAVAVRGDLAQKLPLEAP